MGCQEYQNLYGKGKVDFEDQKAIDHALENGMKRCPNCRYWVYKIDGCDSISCVCGTVFSYNDPANHIISTNNRNNRNNRNNINAIRPNFRNLRMRNPPMMNPPMMNPPMMNPPMNWPLWNNDQNPFNRGWVFPYPDNAIFPNNHRIFPNNQGVYPRNGRQFPEFEYN